MGARRIAAIALSGALIAGGTGAAIAAVTKDDATKDEQAVLDDAAKRLDVTPDKLREALAAAQDAQLDQAVEDGRLTRRQADAIKAARKRSGRVLGPLGGPGFGKGFHRGPGRGVFAFRPGPLGSELAKALGTTQAELREQLRAGKSIADVAKANGKSLDDVRAALKTAAKTRLDKAVKNGDITREQADAMLERIDEKITAIVSERALRPGRHHRWEDKPGAGALRPGGLMPGEDAPELALPGGTFS
jgi:flagellin-like hook-associated protein FlgL